MSGHRESRKREEEANDLLEGSRQRCLFILSFGTRLNCGGFLLLIWHVFFRCSSPKALVPSSLAFTVGNDSGNEIRSDLFSVLN